MELLILVFILAAVVLAEQQLYARLGARHVRYSCGFSHEVRTEGEETELFEIVENRKLLPIPWLKAELTLPKALEPVESDSTVTGEDRFVTGFFMVKSYSGIRRTRRILATGRGVYTVTAARVQTADLLGSVRLSLPASDTGKRLTILPRSADVSAILPERLRRSSGQQLVRQSLLTDPFFTAGVRAYEQGDPMNRIHWNATAHVQELMVRQEEKTARRSLFLLLNVQTASEQSGTCTLDAELAEHTIRLCVQLLEEAQAEGFDVTLCSNGHTPCGDVLEMSSVSLETARFALAELSIVQQMPLRTFLRRYTHLPQDCFAVYIGAYADDAVAAWKAYNPDAALILSAHGTDADGIADKVFAQPERRRD